MQRKCLKGHMLDLAAAPSSSAIKKVVEREAPPRGPSIFAKVVKFPWCDDVAAGNKFFESVANKGRRNGQFKPLQANDYFVVLGAGTHCQVMAVGRLAGRAVSDVSDRAVLYSKLLPERKEALDEEFGMAPSFNYVQFDRVYDMRACSVSVGELAARIGIPVNKYIWQGLICLAEDDSDTCRRLEDIVRGCPVHVSGQPATIAAKVTGAAVTAKSEGSFTAKDCDGLAVNHGVDEQHDYLEIQQGAWCGMHALNNFMGGPYIDRDNCRRAAARVVTELSEVHDGDRENIGNHLHPESGWLSIDVMNMLGRALLGIHVGEADCPLAELCEATDAQAFVNWNQQHWTVLRRGGSRGGWVHLNSQPGRAVHLGRHEVTQAEIMVLLAHIQDACGGVTLHRVTRVRSEGAALLLSAEGMRAMLPPEIQEAVHDDEAHEDHAARACKDSENVSTQIKLVTLNVDALNSYSARPSARMEQILKELLLLSPEVLMFQEVNEEMYSVIRKMLCHWQVRRMQEAREDHFLVTAVHVPATAISCSSYLFRNSQDGRHLLTVKFGSWILVNVHAESGGGATERDRRVEQLRHMSRLYESERAAGHRSFVLAGDFNTRIGEDHMMQAEGWVDAWVAQSASVESWTWRRDPFMQRFDRVYTQDSVQLKFPEFPLPVAGP